jgi:hypothetical protein
MLSGVFLLTIYSVPLTQHLADLSGYFQHRRLSPVPQVYDIFRRAAEVPGYFRRAAGGLWDRAVTANTGFLRAIQQYEKTVEENSAPGRLLLPAVQAFLARHLGVGNEQVYLGNGSWLFYRPDIEYLTGPGFLDFQRHCKRPAAGDGEFVSRQADPRPAILDFHEQLSMRGIELILLPIPIKSMVHPEKFGLGNERSDGIPQNESYAQFVSDLRARGVRIFDAQTVITALKTKGAADLYLATDTHWRPEAMEAVAHSLAGFIRAEIQLPEMPQPSLLVENTSVSHLGDIASMLLPHPERGLYRPETVTVRQVLNSSGETWRPTRTADVLLLGDSFSNIYSMPGLNWGDSAGLAEQLAFELSRPVDAIARNDNGAFATRKVLSEELARGRDRLAGKRVVVWQFAMRELAFGDWKPIRMEFRESPQTSLLALRKGESRIVTGVISETSPVPRPGFVPYADHIVAMHLVELEPEDGLPLNQREAVIYATSMSGNRWTEAARLRPGQRVKAKLAPWLEMEDVLGGINRSELDDERLVLAEPLWAEIF